MTGVSGGGVASGGGDAFAEHAVPVVGSALAAQLAVVEPGGLDDHDLLDFLADCERLASWAAARQLAGAAEFARRPIRVEMVQDDPVAARAADAPLGTWVREFADDEVAVRLGISRNAAATRIRTGCALAHLPRTSHSLLAGRIDVTRARVLVEETAALDRVAARDVESRLIADAERLPASRLRPRVRRAAIAADPVAAAQRCRRAQRDRAVWVTPAADGMADLWAHLPAVDAMTIRETLQAVARASKQDAAPDDDRTMDQRMADALVAPFSDALSTGELRGSAKRSVSSAASGSSDPWAARAPGGHKSGGHRLGRHRGQKAHLNVTVAASTLLGLDDAPAELRGYGPITAETARALTPDARMRRLLTDPISGAVLDVGTTTYKPSTDIVRHVEARDVRCTFPGCGWPAEACDLDHTVPFPEGRTAASQMGPRCRRHHRFKGSGHIHLEQGADGSTTWTFPTGHVYEVAAPQVGEPIYGPEPPVVLSDDDLDALAEAERWYLITDGVPPGTAPPRESPPRR